MAKDIAAAVREICLSFPEATEAMSHGSPDYRVRGKTFASHVVNHHGDGRISLWLSAPPGAQQHYVESEPDYFFVPPYVGPARLARRASQQRARLEARRTPCARSLPRRRAEKADRRSRSRDRHQTADQDNRCRQIRSAVVETRAKQVLGPLRKLCLALPEASEATRSARRCGAPARRRSAACIAGGRLKLQFWVGNRHAGDVDVREALSDSGVHGPQRLDRLDVEDESIGTKYADSSRQLSALRAETDAQRTRRPRISPPARVVSHSRQL